MAIESELRKGGEDDSKNPEEAGLLEKKGGEEYSKEDEEFLNVLREKGLRPRLHAPYHYDWTQIMIDDEKDPLEFFAYIRKVLVKV